jgi:hypothetical protein
VNELALGRTVPDAALRERVERFAEDLDGAAEFEGGGARLTFPVKHRFYRGTVAVRLAWELGPEGTILRAETDTAGAGVNAAGRSLLIAGAAACLPWILWWFFPSLMPLVPLSAMVVFLAWLGVGRRPSFFTPDFFLRALAARLRDTA